MVCKFWVKVYRSGYLEHVEGSSYYTPCIPLDMTKFFTAKVDTTLHGA